MTQCQICKHDIRGCVPRLRQDYVLGIAEFKENQFQAASIILVQPLGRSYRSRQTQSGFVCSIIHIDG